MQQNYLKNLKLKNEYGSFRIKATVWKFCFSLLGEENIRPHFYTIYFFSALFSP